MGRRSGVQLWQCHPLPGHAVDGNAVVKHALYRTVCVGVCRGAVVHDAPARQHGHMVGLQRHRYLVQHAHHRLAFGQVRDVRNARHYDLARQFSRLVAQYSNGKPEAERLYICTGGGPGIMEAANRGAHDTGAMNVGLNIALPHEQNGNPYITPSLSFKFHYFALRKMHFMMRAKALVAFPGGFGTLDELFEVLTLVQTGKAKPVPIVLFGTAFWKKLINFEAMVEEGTISPQDLGLFLYTDDPQEAWDFIKGFYGL